MALQIGDYNIDGFPDILLVTENAESKEAAARLLQSMPCIHNKCSDLEVKKARRYFQWVKEGVTALTAVADVKKAVFFDLDEDVLLLC